LFLKSINLLRRIRELVQELRRTRGEGEQARRRIEQLEEEDQRLQEDILPKVEAVMERTVWMPWLLVGGQQQARRQPMRWQKCVCRVWLMFLFCRAGLSAETRPIFSSA